MKNYGFRFKIIFIASASLFLSFCKSQNPNRYINNKDKFSIQFPNNWEIKENYYGTNVMALSPLENNEDNFRENLNVVVETIPARMSLEDYFSLSVKNLHQLNNFNDEFSGYDEFDNTKVKWLYYTHELANYKLKVVLYQLVKDGKGYSITATAKAEDFDKYKDQFQNSASTFEFE